MKKLVLSIILLATLSACSWQKSEDPFAIQPEDERVILEGEIFPFDVSVSTKATHRLENNGSLAALLTSDIVKLEIFERKKVAVTGVKRTEKMREILVVEKIELQTTEVEDIPEKTEARFLAKDFTFVYPVAWEYSTSPDGTAYFSERQASLRRVFLKFSVIPMMAADKKIDLSVKIAGLMGVKDINTDELDREVQKITLFSNISNNKYEFEFTASYEEFEKKKAFFSLLNSFTEGLDSVAAAKESDLKEDAKILERKLAENKKQKELELLIEKATKDPIEKNDNLTNLLDKVQSMVPKNSVDMLADVEEDFLEESVTDIDDSRVEVFLDERPVFTNLINANAFTYVSKGFGFNMKVPFGFWFRNFGVVDASLMAIGFADQEFSTISEADFTLSIESGAKEALMELTTENELELFFPRNVNSHFVFRGSEFYRNAMYSIWSTIE